MRFEELQAKCVCFDHCDITPNDIEFKCYEFYYKKYIKINPYRNNHFDIKCFF